MTDKISHIKSIRNSNRYKILKYLYTHGKASKALLSRVLKLSPPTISRNLSPYLGNLIKISGKVSSSLGRRADLLEFDYHYKNVLSIHVDRDFIRYGLGDLSGEINYHSRFDVSCYEFADFLAMLERILSDRSHEEKIGAVVFGISGYVTLDGSFYVSICNWKDATVQPVINMVKEFFPEAIVAFENDANLLALREFHVGKNKFKNLVCLYWGRGLGMGLVLNERLYLGRGMAGEIGRTYIDSLLLEEYLDNLITNDKRKAVKEITRFLANLSLIFDPDIIVLNGKFEEIFHQISQEYQHCYRPCPVLLSKGGENAIVQGGILFGTELILRELTSGSKNTKSFYGGDWV